MKRSPAVVVVPLMVLFLVCGPAWASAGAKVPTVGGGSLEMGRIERSTRKGVPRYDDTDAFRLVLSDGRSVELTVKTLEGSVTRWLPLFEEAFLRVVQNVTAMPGIEANTGEVWDKGGGSSSSAGRAPGWVPPSPRPWGPSAGT